MPVQIPASAPAVTAPLDQQPQAQASIDPRVSHEIQLRYKLAPSTLKTLCTIPHAPQRRDALQMACFATEFRSFPIKQAEKAFLRHVNDHSSIPYPIGETISHPWHKVFLLVQVDLHRAGWPNKISAAARKELHQERGRIYLVLDRVLRCLVDILGQRQDGRGVTVALDVLRSVKAGVWEGNEMELLQVEGIGSVKMGKLVQAGVKSIRQLSKMEFYHIERLLSRNPPFGQEMLHHLAGFPALHFSLDIIEQHRSAPQSTAIQATSFSSPTSSKSSWIARLVVGYENEQLPIWNRHSPWTTLVIEGGDGRLVWFWRGSVKRMASEKEMILCLEAKRGEWLKATFACEDIVGTAKHMTVQVPS